MLHLAGHISGRTKIAIEITYWMSEKKEKNSHEQRHKPLWKNLGIKIMVPDGFWHHSHEIRPNFDRFTNRFRSSKPRPIRDQAQELGPVVAFMSGGVVGGDKPPLLSPLLWGSFWTGGTWRKTRKAMAVDAKTQVIHLNALEVQFDDMLQEP